MGKKRCKEIKKSYKKKINEENLPKDEIQYQPFLKYVQGAST